MSTTLLVTGAAGHLGQRVLAHLLNTHKISASHIVAATRRPEKLSDLVAQGIQVRKADFDDPASLTTAFTGIDRLLLISTDAFDRPGHRLSQHKAAIDAARASGVKHLVYTSMPKPDDTLIPFAPDHLGTEQALASSGLGWTILRNSWYMETLFYTSPSALAAGKWFSSAGTGRVGYVSREDCARAAAAALASTNTQNVRYDITGPRTLTIAEVVAAVSQAVGKPIELVQVTDDQLRQGMMAHGMPGLLASLLVAFDANTRAGKVDIQSAAVEQLTGKRPQTLQEFLAANTAALANTGTAM